MNLEHLPLPPPLLLFHGLLSSPQEFGLIAHTLRRQEIMHHALEVAGYSLAGRRAAPDWQQWQCAATDAVIAAAGDSQPVILGGLCMGGMLAATLALAMPQRVAGLVMMSPTFAYDGWGMSPVRHLRHLGYWTGLDRFFSVKEREPYGVKNEKVRELQEGAVSAAGPARVSLRALREADRMLAFVRSRLASLDCPLLMIHARDDEITTLDSVRRVFDALPIPDKQLVMLEDSYHMITIDNERQRVAALLSGFARRVAASSGAAPPVHDTSDTVLQAGACRPDPILIHS
jgi:carboxylesterase